MISGLTFRSLVILSLFLYMVWLTRPKSILLHVHAYMLSGFSRVQLVVILWTVAYQTPLFWGFSRQEDWRGLPFPPPGDLPDRGIEPASPALKAD